VNKKEKYHVEDIEIYPVDNAEHLVSNNVELPKTIRFRVMF